MDSSELGNIRQRFYLRNLGSGLCIGVAGMLGLEQITKMYFPGVDYSFWDKSSTIMAGIFAVQGISNMFRTLVDYKREISEREE